MVKSPNYRPYWAWKSITSPLTLARTHEAPVRSCEKIRQGAFLEAGLPVQPSESKLHNAARDTYRNIRRFGIGWKVPLDSVNFSFEDGEVVTVHFLHPRKLLEYLVCKKQRVIHGGNPCAIEAFWKGYEQCHGSHEVFLTHSNLQRVIPICIHGDEGRGKRRSQTTIVSFECILGMKGDPTPCTECKPSHLDSSDDKPRKEDSDLSKKLCCNLKGHSFLQHFPIFVLPGTWWKTYKTLTLKMMEYISVIFQDLFYTGFQVGNETWHVACVGAKGDLKWHSKVCRFTRGYENKSPKQDLPCCHCCLAGGPGIPAEDVGSQPVWIPTCYTVRPWDSSNPPCLDVIPYDPERPEMMYKHDIFHTLRLGIYRDFCGSTVFLLLRFGCFGPGNLDGKLNCAHGNFRLWQIANRKHAALRSFSKNLLCYKNAKSFPWFNVKGSDCYLLIKWIRTLVIGNLNAGVDGCYRQPMETVLATCEVAISFYDLVSKHNMFISRNCASKMVEKGRCFINGYCALAEYAFSKQWCLYALKPKLHFARHLVLELEEQLSKGNTLILSPLTFDCCQNEDFIGRVCRVARKIDHRIMCHRVLQNYLIKAGVLFDREAEKLVKKRRVWSLPLVDSLELKMLKRTCKRLSWGERGLVKKHHAKTCSSYGLMSSNYPRGKWTYHQVVILFRTHLEP